VSPHTLPPPPHPVILDLLLLPDLPMLTRQTLAPSISRCPTTCSSRHSPGASPMDLRPVDITSSLHPTMDIITRSTEEGRQAASPRLSRQQQHRCPLQRTALMLTVVNNSSSTFPLPLTPIPTPQPPRRSSAPPACLSRLSSLKVNNPVCRMSSRKRTIYKR